MTSGTGIAVIVVLFVLFGIGGVCEWWFGRRIRRRTERTPLRIMRDETEHTDLMCPSPEELNLLSCGRSDQIDPDRLVEIAPHFISCGRCVAYVNMQQGVSEDPFNLTQP